MINTSALADTLAHADEIADAETDEELPEVLFNEAISKQEVVASIGKLKSGKSADPDKIIGEMLKHANEVVIDFLVKLFNKIFDSIVGRPPGSDQNQSLCLFIRKGT